MSYDYSENILVQESAGNLLRDELGWEAVYAYNFEGKRYDTGNKLGFLKATVEFALRREDLGDDFKAYLKDVVSKF